MRRVERIRGTMLPIPVANVDTDQILPGEFLKRVERHGFGDYLFHGWRRDDPGFVLNDPRYAGAKVLVAGANFGVGSSREHAAWALEDWGIEAVVAPSLGDIFRTNCVNVGIVPVTLSQGTIDGLLAAALADPGAVAAVDLAAQTLSSGGEDHHFDIDPFARERLLAGHDAIDLTLQHIEAIEAYEARRPGYRPSVR